jgi:hypothetical protein
MRASVPSGPLIPHIMERRTHGPGWPSRTRLVGPGQARMRNVLQISHSREPPRRREPFPSEAMRHYASTLLLSRPLSAAGLDAPPGDSLGQLARREFESTRRRWVKLLTLLAWLPAIAGAQHRDRVDVGGYRLDVLRSGSGDPAVVFETGLADSLDTWAPIWPAGKFSTSTPCSTACRRRRRTFSLDAPTAGCSCAFRRRSIQRTWPVS